jgi:foldase protein PrsA
MKKKIDNQLYNKMMQDSTTMQSVISTVLKRADVSIKDNDLKDVLSQYISTSKSSN